MEYTIESNLVANTEEPLDDTAITQEPAVEAKVIQGENKEVDIHEHVVNTVVTQEPTMEKKANQGENDTQGIVDEIVVTHEPRVEEEANQGEKEVVTQEPIDYVVVTQ